MRARPDVDYTGLLAPRRHLVGEPYLERRDTAPQPGVLARLLYWLGVIPVEQPGRYTGTIFREGR